MKSKSNVKSSVINALRKKGASPSEIAMILEGLGISPLISKERRKPVSRYAYGTIRTINQGPRAVPEGLEAWVVVPRALKIFSRWREDMGDYDPESILTGEYAPVEQVIGDHSWSSEETPEEMEFYATYEGIL